MATLSAWKAVDVDGRTKNGFVWPEKGLVRARGPFTEGNPCPQYDGDGLCLAKTWTGAAARGAPTHRVLYVTYLSDDVLGEDDDKVRVRKCRVVGQTDVWREIREGKYRGADLRGANLYRASRSVNPPAGWKIQNGILILE